MIMSKFPLLLAVAGLVWTVDSRLVQAQSVTATLLGTVTDQSTRQLERNPPNAQIISVTADPNENSSAPNAVTVAKLFPLAGYVRVSADGLHGYRRSRRTGYPAMEHPPTKAGSLQYSAGSGLHGFKGSARSILQLG
jgi:hypothetical protein